MPDVGVLNLTIKDNSEQAGQGLDALARALSAVKSAQQKFNLSKVGEQVTQLAKTIQEAKGAGTIIKNLGTMFNAINKFSQLKSFTIDSEKIRDTAQSMLKLADAQDRVRESSAKSAGVSDWRTGMMGISSTAKDTATEMKKTADSFDQQMDRIKEASPGWASALRTQIFSSSGGNSNLQNTAEQIEQVGDAYREYAQSAGMVGSTAGSVRSLADEGQRTAENGRRASEAIDSLINSLNRPFNYKGLKEFVDAMTGVAANNNGPSLINESTTMLGSIVDQEEAMERARREQDALTESTEHYFQAFDKVSGTYQYYNEQSVAVAEGSAEVRQNMDDATTAVRNFIDLRNIPASGGNGLFSTASEEIRYLFEQVERSQASLQQWADIYERAATQIKYGGPRDKDELAFDLKHAEEGFYAEYEALERSYTALDNALDAANAYAAGSRDVAAAAEEETARLVALADAAERVSQEMANANVSNVGAVASSASSDTVAAQANANRMAIQMLFDTLENPPQVRFSDVVDNINGIGRGAMSARESMSAFLEAMQGGDAYTAYIRELNPEMADLSDNIQRTGGNFRDLEAAEMAAGEATVSLRDRLDELFQVGKKNFLGRLISQFTRIAKMRAMRYIIRSITQGMREGLENVYYYSQAVGTSFAPAMDSAASSLSQMKNSIGAALAPALQAIIPILNTVVNWFITAVNYVNQFFALLNGQKTWTRALPQTTKAFEKQEKAAKKTGAAIKDLLADWDELNIIQSNTSGAGAGAGTSAAEDYISMFEEVDTFDSKVKDVVNFLKDNFNTIKDVAVAIGAAMLAWKVAGAIYDVLKLVGTLKGGIIMSVVGFTLSAMAGADIAENGFTPANILKTIGGLAASALGGYWIGAHLLGGLFGASAAGMVGAIAGLGIGLSFLINAFTTRTLEKAYGTLTEDAETVRKNVMSYFKPNIEAEVSVTKARIQSTTDAENEVSKALAILEKDYPIAVTLKTAESATQLSDDVKVLVNATNSLIKTRKENIRVPIVLSGQYSDSESLVKFSDEQWEKTSKYIEDIGEKLGKLISDGIVEGAEFDELQSRLSAIVRAVTYGQKSGEFAGKVSIAGSNLRTNGYTKDTVKSYIDTFKTERKNLLDDANAAAVAEKADLGALYATVQERYKNHDATYEDVIRAAKAYESYDVAKEAARYMKEWVGEGDKQFAQDLAEGLSQVMLNNKNFKGGRNRIRANTIDNNMFEYTDDEYINGKIEDAIDAIWGALAEETGMDKNDLKDILGLANINPMDLFDDTFVKEIRDGLFKNMIENGLTKAQREKFFDALGFKADDYKDLETEYATKVSADMHDAIKEAVSNSASDRGLFMSTILGLEDKYGVEDTKRVLAEIYDSMHFREEDNTLKTLLEDYLDIKEKKDSLLGTSGEDIISNENRTVKVGEFWGKITDYMSEKLKNAWDYYKEAQNWVLGDDATSEDIQQLFGELSNEPVELKLKPVLSDETDIRKLYSDLMTQVTGSDLSMSTKTAYLQELMELYTNKDIESLQKIKEIIDGGGNYWKEIETMFFPNGSIRNPNNYIASTGGPLGKRPDVGYPTDNPYFVYPNKVGATEGEDISGDVAKGTKEANRTSEELLRQTAGYLLQLLNKNWTVNVTPTAAWGQHNAKSNDKYTYVTGVEMV